ncbi:MAG: hypothetical protein JXB20_01125, partial [Bacilli bacterium]|nr:hypothetical protein [Bacilli bacterium]
LHFDLGYYSRERYSSYIDILISMAQKYGLDSVPYIVNIHGCSAGRSLKYPIGISQLYQSYRDKPGVISGSDVYLHAVDVPQFTDVFMANVLTDATNASWQPLTSMEFSAGDGDYGNSFGNRYPTSRSDFMTRMFVMHGNRLLNYYSFVGGTNYRFTDKHRDSNDRIANTGEEHGFAAPISPNGIKSYTFDRMAATIRLMRTHEKQLAVQSLVTDDLVDGFIPDYFMTEYHYPDLDPAIHKNLERCRTSMWDTFLKALLLRNYIYTAINIQDDPIPTNKVLLLDSARYMNADIQAKIVNFLISGGRLLLSGEVPQYDLEGERCTLLMDHLGLKPLTRWEDARHKQSMSIMADNFALGRKELHRGFNHTYIYDDPKAIMFRMYDSGEACGFKIKRSGVDAFIVSCPYRADLDLVDKFMASFHIRRRIRHDYETYHGIVLAKTEASDKSGYIHVINLDDFAKEFTIFNEDEQPLSIYLEANSAKMLPFNVSLLPDLKILRTDSEIIDFNDDHLTFKLSGPGLKCSIATSKTLIPQNPDCHLKRTGQGYDIELIERRFNDELLTLRIEA